MPLSSNVQIIIHIYIYIHPYNFCCSVFALHRIHMIFCVMLYSNIGVAACQRCENVSFSQCPIFSLWWQYDKINYNCRIALAINLVPTYSAFIRDISFSIAHYFGGSWIFEVMRKFVLQRGLKEKKTLQSSVAASFNQSELQNKKERELKS